jgi:hypothetical protein
MNKEDARFRLSPEALELIEEQAAHREISEDAVVEIAVRALVEYEKTLGGLQENFAKMREILERGEARDAELDRKMKQRRERDSR